MLHRVALARSDISEECSAPFIRVPPKHRLLQEPHGVTSQKTPFFMVIAVKTSNLTRFSKLQIWILHALDHQKMVFRSMPSAEM
jgi:hypothetical protein